MITISLVLASSPILKAHWHHHDGSESCIKEKWDLIKEEKQITDKCEVVLPLKLKEGEFKFPLIDLGPLKVRYWEALSEKKTHLVQTFEHSFIDVCSGVKTFSEIKIFNSNDSIDFSLQNPNLDPEISETYKLAPLTENEALQEYEKLQTECALQTKSN